MGEFSVGRAESRPGDSNYQMAIEGRRMEIQGL